VLLKSSPARNTRRYLDTPSLFFSPNALNGLPPPPVNLDFALPEPASSLSSSRRVLMLHSPFFSSLKAKSFCLRDNLRPLSSFPFFWCPLRHPDTLSSTIGIARQSCPRSVQMNPLLNFRLRPFFWFVCLADTCRTLFFLNFIVDVYTFLSPPPLFVREISSNDVAMSLLFPSDLKYSHLVVLHSTHS